MQRETGTIPLTPPVKDGRITPMLGQQFVLGYVEACGSGMLPLSECDPVWELGIIGVLLVLALLSLAFSVRSRGKRTQPS
jgi:hypothetical protein